MSSTAEAAAAPAVKEAPPPRSATPAWKVSGTIPPKKVGAFYQLGLGLNAVAMVILPLLYLGLIGLVAWGTYLYATGYFGFGKDIKGTGALLVYCGPLAVGALTVLFMFKPLFARRPETRPLPELSREKEPQLFAFIDEICALVHAPRPRRVVVDMQVNASASFTHGFTSLFSRNLTLTLGLPLVAGLSARNFGGVLAHEFGHFAQGAGMGLTYIIRSLNLWFARLVYERDAWDEGLRNAAGSIDLRVGVFLHLARFMIWLTRKVLWVFMYVGNGLSCFMLRQMEFDADYYEAHTAGSTAYGTTSAQLRLLNVGWQRAVQQQRESFQAGRLVDDLPGLASQEVGRISVDLKTKIDQDVAAAKTGWFDTHPSDADRVRAATALQAAGVLASEAPATALFADFTALSRTCTSDYYRVDCEIDLRKIEILPLAEASAAAEGEERRRGLLEAFFGPLLTIRSLVFLRQDEIGRPATVDAAERSKLTQASKPTAEALMAADEADLNLARARALLDAGYRIKAPEFGAPDSNPATLDTAVQQAGGRMAHASRELTPAIQAVRSALGAALRPGDGSAPLVLVLGSMETVTDRLITLRRRMAGLQIVLQQEGQVPSEGKWVALTNRLAEEIDDDVRRIIRAFGSQQYPFEHARGVVPLSEYLVEGVRHQDHRIAALLRGQALMERLYPLYHRIISLLVEKAAPALGLEPVSQTRKE